MSTAPYQRQNSVSSRREVTRTCSIISILDPGGANQIVRSYSDSTASASGDADKSSTKLLIRHDNGCGQIPGSPISRSGQYWFRWHKNQWEQTVVELGELLGGGGVVDDVVAAEMMDLCASN